MRKLITWNMISLDGYFEGRDPWEIDWFEYAWGEELEQFSLEQAATADMLLFGRRTYQGMAAFWQKESGDIADFMNSVPKLVFSKTLAAAEWNNTRLMSTDAAEEVRRLKDQPGENLYIFGSAELCDSLMSEGLVDEIRLGLVPLVLGGGNPLFKERSDRFRMQLLEVRPLSTGSIILRYAPR